jgi:hypothetical protein
MGLQTDKFKKKITIPFIQYFTVFYNFIKLLSSPYLIEDLSSHPLKLFCIIFLNFEKTVRNKMASASTCSPKQFLNKIEVQVKWKLNMQNNGPI